MVVHRRHQVFPCLVNAIIGPSNVGTARALAQPTYNCKEIERRRILFHPWDMLSKHAMRIAAIIEALLIFVTGAGMVACKVILFAFHLYLAPKIFLGKSCVFPYIYYHAQLFFGKYFLFVFQLYLICILAPEMILPGK